jgi:hypothetical protein
VNPLVDPAQPGVLQLPSLIVVFRKKADCGVEDEGDRKRSAQNAKKSQSERPFACYPSATGRRRERRRACLSDCRGGIRQADGAPR